MGKVVELKGMGRLVSKLEYNCTNREAVKTVIWKNGMQLNEKMKERMGSKPPKGVYLKGYSHGDTASETNTTITDGGMTAEVGPTTDYSTYVEYGTRFMQAEPAVRPAFDEQVPIFKRDMEALVR